MIGHQNLKKNISIAKQFFYKKSLNIQDFQINKKIYYTFFISTTNSKVRAKVWQVSANNFMISWKEVENYLEKMYLNDPTSLYFLKIDLAYNIEVIEYNKLEFHISNMKHNNHFRKGISFDLKLDIAFIEQEIYGNSIIKSTNYKKPSFFDENNLNKYINTKYNVNIKISLEKIKSENKKLLIFNTYSIFSEKACPFIELESTGNKNGIRKIKCYSKKHHIFTIIQKNANYLYNQIKDDGSLIYGYYPAYSKNIKGYNSIRHCLSLYALLEATEILNNMYHLNSIENGIKYTINSLMVSYCINNNIISYIIDGEECKKEIKLGANASAILLITKYFEVTKNSKYNIYAEQLAKGIQTLINSNGETTHVLDYPSLNIKSNFRIIYYDGEAALALLRLYQINQNIEILNIVEKMFQNFIKKNYEIFHDHWLSYCSNELTKILPKSKFFEFGIRNYLYHMGFIRNRETAYATFLELLMAAYKMNLRIQEKGLVTLFQMSNFEELCELIEYRSEYQRIGFFYPEIAMYFKEPQKILYSFFVRHDRFRTRIDDSEHNLSGFIAYYKYYRFQ